jgi:hypothetical protein
MPLISTVALDLALDYLVDEHTALHILHTAEPTLFSHVATNTCGNEAGTSLVGNVEAGDIDGRKVEVAAITDGDVTATETAEFWALVSATELLAAGELASTQEVTDGNKFTLAAFDITLRKPS